jgi:hypothetical protein
MQDFDYGQSHLARRKILDSTNHQPVAVADTYRAAETRAMGVSLVMERYHELLHRARCPSHFNRPSHLYNCLLRFKQAELRMLYRITLTITSVNFSVLRTTLHKAEKYAETTR